jgi:hypothetical protein
VKIESRKILKVRNRKRESLEKQAWRRHLRKEGRRRRRRRREEGKAGEGGGEKGDYIRRTNRVALRNC